MGQENASLNITPEGRLMLSIDLECGPDLMNQRSFTYGWLRVAEEMAARYFMVKELKNRERESSKTILKPTLVS